MRRRDETRGVSGVYHRHALRQKYYVPKMMCMMISLQKSSLVMKRWAVSGQNSSYQIWTFIVCLLEGYRPTILVKGGSCCFREALTSEEIERQYPCIRWCVLDGVERMPLGNLEEHCVCSCSLDRGVTVNIPAVKKDSSIYASLATTK